MLKLILILFLTTSLYQTQTSKIIHLTESLIPNFLKTKKTETRLEIYYFQDCEKSDQLLKELEEIKLQIKGSPIYLIDCKEENRYLCDPYKLKYLPHITYRKKKIKEDIESGLSVKSIIEQINNLNKNFVFYLLEENDYEKIDQSIMKYGVCLLFIGKPSGEDLEVFSDSALVNREVLESFIVENEDILERLGLEHEKKGIYLLRDRVPRFVFYDKELFKSLNDFVEKNKYDQIEELTTEFWENNQKYFSESRNLFFFYNEDCTKKDKKLLEKARFFFHNNEITFFVITKRKNKKLYNKLKKIFGIPNFCTFVVTKKINDFNWEKIMFPGSLSFEEVNFYLENVKKGNVKFYYKSEKESKTEKHILNGDNINFMLKNLSKSKYILFHTNLSKKSEIFIKFKEIIKQKKIDDNFEIFTFNLDLNDYQDFIIDQEPLILFYDEDNEPGNYDRPVEIAEFRKFIDEIYQEEKEEL